MPLATQTFYPFCCCQRFFDSFVCIKLFSVVVSGVYIFTGRAKLPYWDRLKFNP